MEHYLNLLIKPIFINNAALALFLGIYSFAILSKKHDDALKVGISIIVVMAITTPLNALLYQLLLRPGAWTWIGHPETDLSFLGLVVFIGVIATTVKLLSIALQNACPRTHESLRDTLSIITLNCAILGTSLMMVEHNYTLSESAVLGIGSGLGWGLAIIALAGIQHKMRYSDIPLGLRGPGIISVVMGLMAMAFMSITGLQL